MMTLVSWAAMVRGQLGRLLLDSPVGVSVLPVRRTGSRWDSGGQPEVGVMK